MVHLDSSTLDAIGRDGTVQVPTYDRSTVRSGIVHIGVGGFHRAHQAAYVDELLERGESLDFGITGVGLLPGDRRMHDVLHDQDCLYTVVLKDADGTLTPRVVGSIVDHLLAPDDPEAVLAALTDPATRIVSLTITEGGYLANQSTGELEAGDPSIAGDLVPGATPSTAFGFITESLRRRRDTGTAPYTVLSCDNIEGNGELAHRVLVEFAALLDPELADWIDTEVAFPTCMVDRITPVTSEEDRALLAERFGVEDGWPVVCEPFRQWVLEDRFPAGRPAYDEVGVQLVEDVRPYELMKLRLLNAGHQALGYLGYLAGHRYTHEVAADPVFAGFVRSSMDVEATPTLEPVPGVDLEDYKDTLLERFANPEVGDTLARLCAESSDRMPKFLLPVVRANLASDGQVRRSALVVAAWARYAEGTDEAGEPIEVVDRRRDALVGRARQQGSDPLAFLRDPDLFGDLVDQSRFTDAYTEALGSLHAHGARATVEAWQRDDS